jgi:hypothetical protein
MASFVAKKFLGLVTKCGESTPILSFRSYVVSFGIAISSIHYCDDSSGSRVIQVHAERSKEMFCVLASNILHLFIPLDSSSQNPSFEDSNP